MGTVLARIHRIVIGVSGCQIDQVLSDKGKCVLRRTIFSLRQEHLISESIS